MNRLVVAIFAALALAPTTALAGSPLWGYFVRDAEGKLVAGDWPDSASVVFGGDEADDVQLEGLEPAHATLAITGEQIRIIPNGAVWVGDTRVEQEALVTDVVRIGAYRVTVDVRSPDYAPAPPPAVDPVVAEIPAVAEILQVPLPDEAAARAAIWREEEFARRAYRFCNDPKFGEGGVVDSDLCAILDESSKDVCPAALESCPWTEYRGRSFFGSFGGDGSGGGGGAPKSARRRDPLRVPMIPPGIAYVLLGLAVAVLLFVFARALMSAGWEKSELDLAEDEIDEAALDLMSLPEARSHVLLKLAERALARGDPEESAILLHLSILRHLDDEGLARYHPSKTNGDYLRAIRRDKPLAALFRGVATETERVRFGDGRVDDVRLRELLAEGRALLGPKSGPSFANATVILLLALVPSLQGCPQGPEDTRAYYSHGPAGMSALAPTLRAAGLRVDVQMEPLAEIPLDVDTIVFRTSASRTGAMPPELKVDELLDRGTSIVIIDDLGAATHFLPNTATVGPQREEIAPVELKLPLPKDGLFCQNRLADLGARLDADRVIVPDGHRLEWRGLAGIAPVSSAMLNLQPMLQYDTSTSTTVAPAFTAQRASADGNVLGCLYVFAERDLFTNASLTRRENARFVGAFFASLSKRRGSVLFVDRLDRWMSGGSGDGATPPNPTRPLRASNLLPLVLQGLATLALLYIFLGAAFGPLRDREDREHKAFIGHVEAIGRQYARCGPDGLRHSAASLARLVVMRNRERVRGGGSDGGWAVVARELAQKHDLAEEDVRAALRLGIEGKSELGAPRAEDPAPSSERMLQTLSRLLGGRRAELAKKTPRTFRRKKNA